MALPNNGRPRNVKLHGDGSLERVRAPNQTVTERDGEKIGTRGDKLL